MIAIMSVAILSRPAMAVPGECHDLLLRSAFPVFAQVCDVVEAAERNRDAANAVLPGLRDAVSALQEKQTRIDQAANNVQAKLQEVMIGQSSALLQIDIIGQARDRAQASLDQAEQALSKLRLDLPAAKAALQQATTHVVRQLDGQRKLLDLRHALVDRVKSEIQKAAQDANLVLVELTTLGELTFNPTTGSAWMVVDLPGKLSLDFDAAAGACGGDDPSSGYRLAGNAAS